MAKKKRIGFTLSDEQFNEWNTICKNLVERRLFRNKTEIFESLVSFLKHSEKEDIVSFKSKMTI